MDNRELQSYLKQDLDECLHKAEEERKFAKKHSDRAEYWAEQAKCVRAVLHRSPIPPDKITGE